MRKFIVERILPGAGNLTSEELQSLSLAFCQAITQLARPHHWIQSFITSDKIYCVHIAENEKAIREHARLGTFPINTIEEVKSVIDPLTSNSIG